MLNSILSLKPSTWSNQSYTNSTYWRISVPNYSSEHNDVANKFSSTLNILRIERVQHAFAYGHYIIRRSQLNKRVGYTIPEVYFNNAKIVNNNNIKCIYFQYTLFLKIGRYQLDKALQTNLDKRSVNIQQILSCDIEEDDIIIVAKSGKESINSLERSSEIYPEYVVYF